MQIVSDEDESASKAASDDGEEGRDSADVSTSNSRGQSNEEGEAKSEDDAKFPSRTVESQSELADEEKNIQELQAVMESRLKKISEVIAIAESTG